MKVLFQSRKTLFTAPGGDTTQILKTKEYLEKLGIEVKISLELNPDLSGYDMVHFFNLMRPQELYLQVKNAVKQGKKIALSTIYGPYEEYEKKVRGGILHYLNKILNISQIEYLKVIARAILNLEINKGTLIYLFNGHKRLQRKIIKNIDVFLPNSVSEMERVVKDFCLKKYTYVSVPNAVDIKVFDLDSTIIDEKYSSFKDCVLCVARIEGRKNQLNVVRVARGLPYKFVFIGNAGTNSKKYLEKCKTESNKNCFFLGQIPHKDLPQFYKLCKVHVLPSWMETPGLSSLEAGVMRSNIVVSKKGDTEDYFKNYAWYCEPDNINSIRDAIRQAFESDYNENLRLRILNNYKWEDTAKATLEGYNKILDK